MAIEKERKYLVKDNSYRNMAVACLHIRQGYLSHIPERVVRVRTVDEKGYLTVKSINHGDERLEFEYEVPFYDALQMLNLCDGIVLEKKRYIVPYCGFSWEIDEFEGKLAPLVVAEIEFKSSDANYELPPFVGEDVTGNPRYYNSNLEALS